MDLHEYQVKQLLRAHRIRVPKGGVAYTAGEARAAALKIGGAAWMVKAQVRYKGRSQGVFSDPRAAGMSGIVRAASPDEVRAAAEMMLENTLATAANPAGTPVRQVYVEEAVPSRRKWGMSIRVDFQTQSMMWSVRTPDGAVVSAAGDTDREGLKKLMRALALPYLPANRLEKLLGRLYDILIQCPAVAVELDPVAETEQGRLVALDGRIVFDGENVPLTDWARGGTRFVPPAVWARQNRIRYHKLAGNIACLVDGMGLGLATIDLVQARGGAVGCLFDLGTNPTQETIAMAVKMALADTDVDGVLVNIFGGIIRGEEIAGGLIAASHEVLSGLPVVVRMDGTNAHIGQRMLFESRVPFTVVQDLDEAVQAIVSQVREK
ncbi:MAG: hypothetical protein PHX68_03240 [Alphaproteobacteria bacterium]|nr:hypothetical protein [Alphaproteobacteria bacterium]